MFLCRGFSDKNRCNLSGTENCNLRFGEVTPNSDSNLFFETATTFSENELWEVVVDISKSTEFD